MIDYLNAQASHTHHIIKAIFWQQFIDNNLIAHSNDCFTPNILPSESLISFAFFLNVSKSFTFALISTLEGIFLEVKIKLNKKSTRKSRGRAEVEKQGKRAKTPLHNSRYVM